jgi:hypothetical protein
MFINYSRTQDWKLLKEPQELQSSEDTDNITITSGSIHKECKELISGILCIQSYQEHSTSRGELLCPLALASLTSPSSFSISDDYDSSSR